MRRCGAFPFRKKDFGLSCFQNSFLNVKRATLIKEESRRRRRRRKMGGLIRHHAVGRTLLIVLELFFIDDKMFSHMAVNMCCKYLLYYYICVVGFAFIRDKGNRIVAKGNQRTEHVKSMLMGHCPQLFAQMMKQWQGQSHQ